MDYASIIVGTKKNRELLKKIFFKKRIIGLSFVDYTLTAIGVESRRACSLIHRHHLAVATNETLKKSSLEDYI